MFGAVVPELKNYTRTAIMIGEYTQTIQTLVVLSHTHMWPKM
jgi:hypothetical protein